MLDGFAPLDGFTLIWVAMKALVYGAVMLGCGSVLALAVLPGIPGSDRPRLCRIAIVSAGVAMAASLSLVPLQSGFLAGGDWGVAFDPGLLDLVWDGPLGDSTAVRLIGLALVLCFWLRGGVGLVLAGIGAVLALSSFALFGHGLREPRWILGGLITLHLICLAFWVGVFLPLHRAARLDPAEAATLAEAFGRKAVWAVALLTLAGGAILWIFAGGQLILFDAPYGRLFLVKFALFLAVMGLAALNKLRLTDALAEGRAGAARAMRRSLEVEAVLIGLVLLATAFLTTISSPPAGVG